MTRTAPRWTPAALRRLKALYGSRPDEDVAAELGRPVDAVRAKARSLALGKDKRAFPGSQTMPRWTEAEIATLRKLFPDVATVSIARRLGRSVKSVGSKASLLGLSKSPEYLAEMGRQNVKLRGSDSA